MLKQKNTLLYLSFGVPIALGVGYFFYRSRTLASNDQLQEFDIPEINNAKLQLIVKQINRQIMDQPLSQQPELMKKIYRRSIELISKQYVQLVKHQRKKRRSLIKDKKKYVQCLQKQQQHKKQLKDQAINMILAQNNISQDSWSQAIITWTLADDANQQQWNQLVSDMQSQLLEQFQLQKRKPISLDSILGSHVKFMKSVNKEKQEFKGIPREDIPIVVNEMVNDELFFLYGLQKQDIASSISELKQKERNKLQKYFDQMQEIFQQLVALNESHSST